MRILRDVYLDIINTFKGGKVEAGGIIGSKDNQIIAFEFDRVCSVDVYIPDIVKLNTIIKKWYESEIRFAGIIHSHMDSKRLSYADIEYAKKVIIQNSLDWIYMLVYVHSNNKIYTYKAYVKNNIAITEEVDIIVRSK